MKRSGTFILILISSGMLLAFSVLKYQEKKVADEGSLLPMLYQQNAGEYRALCLQAYGLARLRAEEAWRRHKDHQHLAIVTDLDETALDNTPGEAFAYQKDFNFVDSLGNWWLHGKPKAVPGAVAFFRWAREKGFHIYYISNRTATPAFIDSTRSQMHRLGFPNTASSGDDRYFLFQPAGSLPTKQPRRDTVTQRRGDKIVLLLGDNLIDLDSTFDKISGKYQVPEQRLREVDQLKAKWGTQYIVFPNAYYGDWESAHTQLYKNKHHDSTPATMQQKYAFRESLLKTDNFVKRR